MDMHDIMAAMQEHAKAAHYKHHATEVRELGCVPLGPMVARLTKKWPSAALVADGTLAAEEMDGDGGLPEVYLYRPGRRMVEIQGRANLDALADMLNGAGYGNAGRS